MARATAFARQVEVFKNQLTGEARKQFVIAAAVQARDEAMAQNEQALGRKPAVQTIVDGSPTAPLTALKPGGNIVFLFAVGEVTLQNAVDEAFTMLERIAPRLTGRFASSFRLLVNGQQRDAGTEGGPVTLHAGDEAVIVNLQPYARKIERGFSEQAPNGVFEVTAAALRSRYGGILKIGFAYQEFPGFAVGRTRTGGRPKTRSDIRRSQSYPVITLSLK